MSFQMKTHQQICYNILHLQRAIPRNRSIGLLNLICKVTFALVLGGTTIVLSKYNFVTKRKSAFTLSPQYSSSDAEVVSGEHLSNTAFCIEFYPCEIA